MLKNYITIALRNISRQFLYSFINILGLAVGMACSLVIFLYVYGEWSHDKHITNGDRIYRIGVSFFNLGQFAKGPEALEEFLPKEFEGIEVYTSFNKNSNEQIRVDNQTYKEAAYYVDSVFFKVFQYDFSEGTAATAISSPSSIVITESMALKYFKDVHAVGRTLEIGEDKVPFTVTGIVKDPIHNSHLKASVWISRDKNVKWGSGWSSAAVYNYVLLREGVSEADLKAALDRIIEKQVFPQMGGGLSLEQYIKNENSVKFFVQPLRDIYLKSKLSFEVSPGGNETNMYIFAVIAFFILTLAAVNFINLSTARATRRAREVGIRKSLGTSRGMLVSQFLLESVLVCIFSMLIALCLAELFVLGFFWVTGQELSVRLWSDPTNILGVLLFAVIVGLLAGIYPAFYLTGFQPAKVLKGTVLPLKTQNFRNGLVVFQFSISITLIISSAIIIRQLNFISNKDLGFSQENVVTIDNLSELKTKDAITLKNELANHPGVINASLHAGEPGSKAVLAFYTYKTPQMPNDLTINTYLGDENYLDVMGFKLISGRNFDKDLLSDTASVILNESAVKALDLGENAIGAVLNENQKVIGVVSDFHWESLRNAIAPVAIVFQHERRRDVSYFQLGLKLNSSDAQSVLNAAEQKWKNLVPEEPIAYHFLDENFGTLLEKEEVLGKAIGFFTVLAILISCLGLFGLAAYTTDQRTKEIGIRKVLGATVTNIVFLLNKQFTRLVLISILIAIPISYYAATQWLSGFAYRIDLTLWIFLAGGLVGLLISYATVAFHSLKASQTNPADTLKYE